jgi:hypothetical protein
MLAAHAMVDEKQAVGVVLGLDRFESGVVLAPEIIGFIVMAASRRT